MKPCVLFILCIWINHYSHAESLEVLTEEFPPFNYSENGSITGFSTEVVKAVLQEANITGTPKSYPWARAYNMALEKKDVLIYTIGFSKERAALFKWVGPISLSRGYLYKLTSRTDIQINELASAAQYKLGLPREFAITQKLMAMPEFSSQKNIYLVNQLQQMIGMLKLGRIELMFISEPSLIHLAKQLGIDISMLEKAYPLEEVYGYMALNLQTSDDIVHRLQSALNRLKVSGKYQQILDKHSAIIDHPDNNSHYAL